MLGVGWDKFSSPGMASCGDRAENGASEEREGRGRESEDERGSNDWTGRAGSTGNGRVVRGIENVGGGGGEEETKGRSGSGGKEREELCAGAPSQLKVREGRAADEGGAMGSWNGAADAKGTEDDEEDKDEEVADVEAATARTDEKGHTPRNTHANQLHVFRKRGHMCIEIHIYRNTRDHARRRQRAVGRMMHTPVSSICRHSRAAVSP
jgi:hypothetical protein